MCTRLLCGVQTVAESGRPSAQRRSAGASPVAGALMCWAGCAGLAEGERRRLCAKLAVLACSHKGVDV